MGDVNKELINCYEIFSNNTYLTNSLDNLNII